MFYCLCVARYFFEYLLMIYLSLLLSASYFREFTY